MKSIEKMIWAQVFSREMTNPDLLSEMEGQLERQRAAIVATDVVQAYRRLAGDFRTMNTDTTRMYLDTKDAL